MHSSVFAQKDYRTLSKADTFKINFENKYLLSSTNIIPFTEKIILRKKLLSKEDYNISYKGGFFTLADTLAYSILDSVFITYKSLRLNLKKEYFKRELVKVYDEERLDTVQRISYSGQVFSNESIFGNKINKSGTLVRGFTVGTTKDFSVSSGLRLQLSGKLSDDIEIVAALTDENSPIQPEGNTERIEELDKVFIEVRHKNAVGTFGDYDFESRLGEFGKIDRKLKGLKGEILFDNINGTIATASSRGKFNTNLFNGEDGNQGPYRLAGANGEKNIIVIAGSEKIFVDGIEMKRGQNNDYIIEYSNATITFSPNRLITSASRINVDFEYTDRNYSRNFFGTTTNTNFFNDKLKISLGYFREGDNQDSPIDFILSDSEKKILEQAGDDRDSAVISGIRLAEPDSIGNVIGQYTKVDTTISGNQLVYYKYLPGVTTSIYNVNFSFIGSGQGSYTKEGLGNYIFVGTGNGDYLPIIFVPLPELRQVGNLVIETEPIENLILNIDLAGSMWDKNRLSSLNDNDNNGFARKVSVSYLSKELFISGFNIGKFGVNFKDRFIENRFTSLDRINNVEFNRDYGIDNPEVGNEILRETGLSYYPINELKINSNYGLLKKGSSLRSDRFYSSANLTIPKKINALYKYDYVASKNDVNKTEWLRQNSNASYTLGKLKPGFEYLFENKEVVKKNSDSLLSTSLKYYEIVPKIEIKDIYSINFTAKYSMRKEYSALSGLVEEEANAYTHIYNVVYRPVREISGDINFTFRNKKYTEAFRKLGRIDNETILIKNQNKLNFFKGFISGNLFYQATTEKQARLEKVFIKVPIGTGNYIYLGDLNNNGVAEENEFQLVSFDGEYIIRNIPTDELFPIIDLRTDMKWRINFNKVFNGNSFLSSVMKALSTESNWRVDEKNRSDNTKDIYLLNFSKFLNDSTTIQGSNFIQQDLHVFRNKSDLSFRLRYSQKKSLNQFSGGTENGYVREQSLRIKFRMVKEINNQTEIINQVDNLTSAGNSNRSRLVSTNEVISDFSYRPIRRLEVGFKIRAGKSEDKYPTTPTIINTNSQTLRMSYSFSGKGRLRVEAERSELNANSSENYIPFEITKGNAIGKNYFWRVNFDYRIGSNLQTNLSYDGRLQGAGKVVNTFRAEARAYF